MLILFKGELEADAWTFGTVCWHRKGDVPELKFAADCQKMSHEQQI
jgi:hypothetical protein